MEQAGGFACEQCDTPIRIPPKLARGKSEVLKGLLWGHVRKWSTHYPGATGILVFSIADIGKNYKSWCKYPSKEDRDGKREDGVGDFGKVHDLEDRQKGQ